MTVPIGLYIHIPFCRLRCDFCAFYFEIHREPAAESFLRSLTTELRLHATQADIAGRTVQTLYFGGGTPTALRTAQLLRILDAVRQSYSLATDCEITVEAHPGTVTDHDLDVLLSAGVNRISFGAESLHDDELKQIGRPGTKEETITAVHAARKTGFININLDLMYGLPGQSLKHWEETLLQSLQLSPSHVSCYALTIEEGTPYAHAVRHQRTEPPDETMQIEMFRAAQNILANWGFEHYEISNYAKPGFICRHNQLYWTNGDYLGLGPSAQSFVQGVRFGKVANLTAYHHALADGRLPIHDPTRLSREEHLRDAVIFGLRLLKGVPTSLLLEHARNFGRLETLHFLKAKDLIEDEGDRTRLSAQGQLHADTIAEQLY
ncbi:radical SAM family heme chaperone HemW [Petrachloros mirabilis]